MGGQHDPGILRTRLGKLRKVAPHATSKRTLEVRLKGAEGTISARAGTPPLLSAVDAMFKRSELIILLLKRMDGRV